MRALVLDIGGVLADVRRDLAAAAWTAETGRAADEFFETLFAKGRKVALDAGRLSPADFFGGAAATLGEPSLTGAFETAYRALLVPRPWVGLELARLRPSTRVVLFSNIDPFHFDALSRASSFLTRRDGAALSFEGGFRKPSPESFSALDDVLRVAAPTAERAVLLDDTVAVIAAARVHGLDGRRVESHEEVRRELARLRAEGW